MTRILHLSDIHFGAVDTRLVEPMLALARALGPDATVISGDLTQRARATQFADARAFASRLPQPLVVVPGNHDVPLGNLLRRFFAPFAGYRAAFGPEVPSRLDLPGAILQGVNTANPWVWKAGRLTQAGATTLHGAFQGSDPNRLRIAVMHHAPVAAADGTPADMAAPAAALAALARAGTDIVLSGHTHMPHSGSVATAAGILFLQVGTAISTRLKTDANDFSLIELQPGGITLRSWTARAGGPFAEAPPARFLRGPGGWQRLTA